MIDQTNNKFKEAGKQNKPIHSDSTSRCEEISKAYSVKVEHS